MKNRFFLLTVALCAGFAFVFCGGSHAAPGDLDTGFNPNPSANGDVYCTALQPDGKILIGGFFTTLLPNGATTATTRNRLARLNADGSLDTAFNPNANGTVYNAIVQADGKILIGGSFTTLQPNGATTATTRNRIARLNADGTLDTAFNPNANNSVDGIALQPDGKIVVYGLFSTLQPNGAASATTRIRLARLNADGSLDTAFDPNPGPITGVFIYCTALQPDGKIIIGGYFSTLQPNGAASATTRNNVARLNADGSLDTAFNPNANDNVFCTTVQTDGKVILGGSFYTLQPNGAASATTRNCIARLNADGSLDTAFNPNASSSVYCTAVQTDGKIIVGGYFATLQPNGAASPTSRGGIARLNSDGSLDPVFDPKANNIVYNATVQNDGKIILGGKFTTLQPNGAASATTRNYVARVANNPVLQRLTVGGPTTTETVQLLRDGALPEVQQVTFEASADGGVTWKGLRTASRITGGWRATGFALPAANGLIRTRARFSGGYDNGSSGLLEVVAPYPAPDIAVEQPANTLLLPGSSTVDYGEIPLGGALSKVFTVRNAGSANFHITAITTLGTNTSEFVVDTSNTNFGVDYGGDSTIFEVVFTPTGASGLRNATLRIATDINGGNTPYDIALTGLGLSATSSTGNDGLSDHAKYGLSALGFDWHLSQPALVQALYAGAANAGLYTSGQVQALNVGVPLIQRDPFTGQFKLTIAVKQSANLQTYTPLSLSTGSTQINSAGALEFYFNSPSGAQFYRLQSQ